MLLSCQSVPVMQIKRFAVSSSLITMLLLSVCACATSIDDTAVETNPAPAAEASNSSNIVNEIALGSCGLEIAESSDEGAIRAVVNAEGQFVVAQDIDALMALWANGSYIKNAKNSANDESDDQVWKDVDAIRHRYVRSVFPGAPSGIQPADLQIDVNGSSAVVISTTRIGDEVSPSGDRWELKQQDGCWLIHSLAYNLEPN